MATGKLKNPNRVETITVSGLASNTTITAERIGNILHLSVTAENVPTGGWKTLGSIPVTLTTTVSCLMQNASVNTFGLLQCNTTGTISVYNGTGITQNFYGGTLFGFII